MAHIGRRGLLAGAAGVLAAVSAAAPARAFHGQGARGSAPVPAFRGMWVASVENVDWPSAAGLSAGDQEAELVELLDTAVRRRLNAVVLQVRPTADAMWPSALEPWSQWLTGRQGVDPGWDPLGTAVARAHERGLELHAWFNPYRVANHANPSLLVPEHPARLHPEWVVPYGGKLYYNPGLPEVRDFVQRAMLDAVRRYPLDAVHWDDYFYPYPVDGQYFDDDRAFEEHGSGFGSRADWRRYNIDTLVREMAAGIEAARPGVRFGVSPFAVWRNEAKDPLGSATQAGVATYDDLYADTRRWVREGWIHYIAPQLYWQIGHPQCDYETLVDWWSGTVRGTGVDLLIGEALYRCDADSATEAWRDPAELSRHLSVAARYPEVRGHVYFSAKQVVADRNGAMARVVDDHYPTRVPPR
ncbi:family 10 glycosylhydrolase [Streptomyces sp. NBC_00536]|uniref:glycoside hydrolase family 10 protein n=1 Tax=Streptomyces sp. NBC_00536 TaxID=2975769 RepID=UPI002E82328F|nr:family 10 glycosylhydrolase [Streptomyces sp. NBC_00536]WUC78146.1 family 10 glycosylhydrolase [Streptomyces sp. NBC_00536]